MKVFITALFTIMIIAGNVSGQATIKYDGSDIQEFINQLPDNSIVEFEPDTLVYEESLIIQSKKNISFRFNGFTIRSKTTGENSKPTLSVYRNKWPRNRSHLVINRSDSIEITGLVIWGPHKNGGTQPDAYNPKLEAQHAIEIHYSKNILLDKVELSHIYGDGVYINNNSSEIQITNARIQKNGRQGIAIVDGHDILIKDCSFDAIRRSHIDLEPNNDKQQVKNVKIVNNTFGGRRLNWIAAGSSKGKVGNIVVEDNLMNCGANIWIGNKTNKFRQGPYVFRNNKSTKLYGTSNGGIWRLIQVDGFVADGNEIMGQELRNMSLIYATRCNDIELGDNEVIYGNNAVKTFYQPKEKN